MVRILATWPGANNRPLPHRQQINTKPTVNKPSPYGLQSADNQQNYIYQVEDRTQQEIKIQSSY